MNVKLEIDYKDDNDNILLYCLMQDGNELGEEIIVDTTEKTITNLKAFFTNILEKSFLNDKVYSIDIKNEEELDEIAPGISELLHSCIDTYNKAIKNEED